MDDGAHEHDGHSIGTHPSWRKSSGGKQDFKSFLSRIRKSTWVSLFALLGTAVVAISSFSDAATNLYHAMFKLSAPDISGAWISSSLTNPYDDKEHTHLSFNFDTHGSELNGIVSETNEDEPHKGARFDYPIQEGKIEDGVFSFHTSFEVMDDPKEYAELYEGRVKQGELSIRRWSNYGGGNTSIETFSARRPAKNP